MILLDLSTSRGCDEKHETTGKKWHCSIVVKSYKDIEHLLVTSRCIISYNVFNSPQLQRPLNVLLWRKGLTLYLAVMVH